MNVLDRKSMSAIIVDHDLFSMVLRLVFVKNGDIVDRQLVTCYGLNDVAETIVSSAYSWRLFEIHAKTSKIFFDELKSLVKNIETEKYNENRIAMEMLV